ncbi:hypothetical protein [Spiroplasma endosymbiont of Danaus chrysippus]|uniref:hypothetical protein n=1 Tax=Spiroplasma endosymbiont of Danaus chrysippus TaxID=2691041 RepID=UPI00157B6B06|nr:hypothetical protein [Spiroplasma endosymbiont of Danaus chrysippus]
MKYKINSNSASKDMVNQDKHKKIKTESNSICTINVKKNKKKRILLFSLYLLAFGSTTVTTILLLHTTAAFNNSEFNPNSNNKLWDDYYQKHHRNSEPISLDSTIAYFSKSTNIVNFNVIENAADNGNIDFTNVLSSIDNNLKKTDPKIESDIDNDNSNLLPINFFLNANYNPAVKFTVGKDKKPITNTSFILPKNFNESKSYVLNLTTNDQASIFGIESTNVNIEININIINQVAINIASLPVNFPDKIINITNPENATIDSIKDKWLIPTIQDQFATILSKALNVPKKEIKPSYYKIEFQNGSEPQNFTKSVPVQFSITSLDNNPWNFTGKKDNCTINVKNDIADLSSMKELTNEIETQYNNDKDNKNFQITLDNQKDKNGNFINAGSKLSEEDVKFVNSEIIESVKKICQSYFQKNYSDLNIKDSDYTISTNLNVGNNIFNNKLGKNIEIKITANPNDHKLTKSLDNIKAIVHGHNKNNITGNYPSPKDFALKGIWLKDGQDANILQEGQHFYEQDNLLGNWITNKDSLLNKINNNSYRPVENAFTGQFTMNYLLDGDKTPSGMSVDISKDIKGDKANNFWDLITQTKSIFLETDVAVTTKSGWELNNVKLVFTDSETQPTKDNTLYTLDLSERFAGKTISDRATLTFPDFNFNFNYQLVS